MKNKIFISLFLCTFFGTGLALCQLSQSKIYESLHYASYLGGEGKEEAWPAPSIFYNDDGSFYMAGLTKSVDFLDEIATINRFVEGQYNLFVFHFRTDSTGILAAAIPGPVNSFRGVVLTRDGDGNVITGGFTSSPNYELIGTGYKSSFSGGTDAILIKLNSSLTEIIKQSYFGGSGNDELYGLSIKGNSLYLCGTSTSSDLPVHQSAFQKTFMGAVTNEPDLFIACFDNNFNTLQACTYLGGTQMEAGYLCMESESVLISGFTNSSNYPVTENAYDKTFNGFFDVVITRLSLDLSQIEASTYIGGPGGDFGYYCTIDKNSNIYFTGHGAQGFPISQYAYDRSYNGGPEGYDDVIVGQLDYDLTTLNASTYIGGSQFENGFKVLVDPEENILICGYTYSSNYPVIRNGWDQTFGGGSDVFITTLKPDLSDLTFSSFIGGNGEDREVTVCITADERLVVATETQSNDLSTTKNPISETLGGESDLSIFIFGENRDPSFIEELPENNGYFKMKYQDQKFYYNFWLENPGEIRLTLYNIQGQLCLQLLEEIPNCGDIEIIIPDHIGHQSITPGIYIGQLYGSFPTRSVKIGIVQ